MNETAGQIPGPKNETERLAQLRLARAAALVAAIPTTHGRRAVESWSQWALVVTQLYGRRGLARVAAPWTIRHYPKCPAYASAGQWRRLLRSAAFHEKNPHAPARVSRGRASNPTAY